MTIDAEQAVKMWHEQTKTVSMPVLIKRYWPLSRRYWTKNSSQYTFPDGSSLVTSGRGMHHRITIKVKESG